MPAPEPSGMIRLDELAHLAAKRVVQSLPDHVRPILIDATAGNGYDACFLAGLTERGTLYAFDIQETALTATRIRLQQLPPRHAVYHLISDSHANLARYIQDNAVHVALFNLGFLPGSDKTITTMRASTLAALTALESRMAPDGLISIHLYTGQINGLEETRAVLGWAASLPRNRWHVLHLEQLNKPDNPEHLLLIASR